jgi:hypothetical protein
MKRHLITIAGISFVTLLVVGIVLASPFPGFIDAIQRDYRAFVAGAGSSDVHQLGRDLERLQALEARE